MFDGESFNEVFAELREIVPTLGVTRGVTFVRASPGFTPKVDQVASVLEQEREREEQDGSDERLVVLAASAGGAAVLQLAEVPEHVRRVILLSPVSLDNRVPETTEDQDWIVVFCEDEARAPSIRSLAGRLPASRTRVVALPGCDAHAQHIFKTPSAPALVDVIRSALLQESG
jgi:pimeloyl-ACP methyl ester carboxylesterase